MTIESESGFELSGRAETAKAFGFAQSDALRSGATAAMERGALLREMKPRNRLNRVLAADGLLGFPIGSSLVKAGQAKFFPP